MLSFYPVFCFLSLYMNKNIYSRRKRKCSAARQLSDNYVMVLNLSVKFVPTKHPRVKYVQQLSHGL